MCPNLADFQAFNLSDDGFHAPHQLRPDLRDQVLPYALARVEGTMEPSLVVSPPHDVHRTSTGSAETLLYVAMLHG
jgi:hypothetical protein